MVNFQYLAGHIENSPENMMWWIQHPRAHDERTAMPDMGVTERDSRDIVACLIHASLIGQWSLVMVDSRRSTCVAPTRPETRDQRPETRDQRPTV
jgi:hypothetical protein